MAAPTTAARVKKTLANPEPSTHGPYLRLSRLSRNFRVQPSSSKAQRHNAHDKRECSTIGHFLHLTEFRFAPSRPHAPKKLLPCHLASNSIDLIRSGTGANPTAVPFACHSTPERYASILVVALARSRAFLIVPTFDCIARSQTTGRRWGRFL